MAAIKSQWRVVCEDLEVSEMFGERSEAIAHAKEIMAELFNTDCHGGDKPTLTVSRVLAVVAFKSALGADGWDLVEVR